MNSQIIADLEKIAQYLGTFQCGEECIYSEVKEDLKYGKMAFEWLEYYNALREMNR